MSFSTLGSICSDRNTDRIKKLKECFEKEETKKLTKRDVEFYERVNTGKLTTLHGYRKLYGHCRRSEEQLYVAIYNCSIDAKVLYKREHANDTVWDVRTGKWRKKVVFPKTQLFHKVSDYSCLTRKYNKRSLDSLKNRLRHLLFSAFDLNGGMYSAETFCSIVQEVQVWGIDHIVEGKYGELKDAIYRLIGVYGTKFVR